MAILGQIIKTAIDLTDKVLPTSNHIENQQEVLKDLLEKAKDTAFGRHYHFEQMLQGEDQAKAFARQVPYHSYQQMHEAWWSRQLAGEKDISWPGSPNYYALSSGTTGKASKRIPITDDMLEAIRKTGVNQVLALSNFELPPDFYEREVMMLSSSTHLKQVDDHLEGEISGISASNIPGWFQGYYRPGNEIAKIEDWDERVKAIAKEAPNWDIGAISGIPAWNELMLKEIIAYHGLKNIHEIWPNLQVFASGGVAFAPYRKSFDALTERPLTVIDTYLASEGFLAYQARPNEAMAMQLATSAGIYFEFVPFEDRYMDEEGQITADAPSYSLAEVKEGTDYALIISTAAGAWRYMIGDTIRFTSVENAEIVITGRTKHFLNVVGSQLSVLKLNEAIQHLEEQFQLKIPEYTVAAVRPEGEYIHHWYLAIEGQARAPELAQVLDEFLQGQNKNYRVARQKALNGVEVSIVSPDTFHNWYEKRKKKGGQVKVARVMKEEAFQEWQAFAEGV